jgi:hypothetical protein
VKRIVVLLALAGVLAVLGGGSLVAAGTGPQNSVATSQQPQPEDTVIEPPPEPPARVDRGRETLEFSIDPCGNSDPLIHVTLQYRWVRQGPDIPPGASASASPKPSPGEPIIYRYVYQGSGEDSEGNRYRIVETGGRIEISPGDPDYPNAYVKHDVVLVQQQGAGKDGETFARKFVLRFSPNGLSSFKEISNDCPPSSSASASASAAAEVDWGRDY